MQYKIINKVFIFYAEVKPNLSNIKKYFVENCYLCILTLIMEHNEYIYTLEIAVRDYELDSEGIVNNANYLHYLELTRHEFCRWAGYSFKEMSADGIIPVLNRVEIDYKTPLRSGDVMLSSLWVEKKGVRFVFHQDIRNKYTGEMAVSAVVSVVSLENGKLSRGDILFEKFEKWL